MTKSLINIIFAFILLSFTANTKTQAQQAAPADPLLKPEYSYRKYTVQDGLPEAICLALYQDTGGYIWVGAMSGFARFDGYMFKRYLADSDEAILHFYEDSHGNVSGIALKQLHQVDAGSDSVHSRRAVDVEDTYAYIISNSMPNGFGIYRVQNSRGIYAYADTGLVKVWEHEKLNDMSDTQKPYWDREGQRFFVPTRKGTYIIGENGIVADSFSIKAIACFVPHKTGFRAVAPDGIYEYDNHNFKCILSYPFYSEGADEYDYSALEDAAGNLIIRTETAIFRFRDGKLETIADHLPPTNDICIDREGNLWVATAEGIYNFFRLNFKNHTLPKGEYIQLVLNEGQSRTWMTTLSGDLMRWDGEDAKKVNYPSSPYPYVYFDQTGT
ncbi:MAG: hypothetical protein LBE56_15300, partial [Tannerella sp.]|nr:hypothetical protein [Tannerella sp.]